MNKNQYKKSGFLLVLVILVILASVFFLSSGELKISMTEIPKIFRSGEGLEYSILRNLRVPRLLLAIAVGGSLSLTGAILQGIYRNPLVEPYTLGISGGAALGVALVIVLGVFLDGGSFLLPVGGFAGASLSLLIVYALSFRRGSVDINQMLLIGVMVSFIASASMMFIMALTTSDNIHSIVFWIMGSLDEPNPMLIRLTVMVAFIGMFFSLFFARALNALRLGEVKARHLGINSNAAIRYLFIIASILTGVSVSVAGVIGFVGLIIPHMTRYIFGSDYRFLLAGSFLGGSFFLIICDIIARKIIAPNELPIGVITGILGGIVFIFLLSGSKNRRKLDG